MNGLNERILIHGRGRAQIHEVFRKRRLPERRIGGAQRFHDRLDGRQNPRELTRRLAHSIGQKTSRTVHGIQNG